MGAENKLTIIDVNGPFREPREPVFSYDYSIQRPNWPSPYAVRVKISIPDELDVLKTALLGTVTGTPGQQLLASQVLTRRIAEEKLRIAEQEGQLRERGDAVIAPFTGPLAHQFTKLQSWLERERASLRAEVKKRANL